MTDNKHLGTIWAIQKDYNNTIRSKEPGSYDHWMKNYLLGAVSEVDEILNEINWKAHRKGKVLQPHNLARELADLTKYVFSMWEWSGFDSNDMLRYVAEKSEELELQRKQDFDTFIPPGAPVIISDIDGTIGDWRGAFVKWMKGRTIVDTVQDAATSMAIEVNLGLSYPAYANLKEQFEAEGGYKELEPYEDAVYTLNTLAYFNKVHLILYTARPARVHTRVWSDTWHWLEVHDMGQFVQELRIGHENRIARACELAETGHPVLLLEDDPTLALRAASTGIRVAMRAQPYNKGILHENILRLAEFAPGQVWSWLMTGVQNGK